MNKYYNFTKIAIGTYTLPHVDGEIQRIKFCVAREYHGVVVNKTLNNGKYNIGNEESECRYLLPPGRRKDLASFIAQNNLPEDFHWVLSVKMMFDVRAINLKQLRYYDIPDCYTFSVLAHFDNSDQDAVMQLHLDSPSIFQPCRAGLVDDDSGNQRLKAVILTFDLIVILVCLCSALLCLRSFKCHLKLCKEVTVFFRTYRHEEFTWSDKLNFINFWIILIIISDTLTVCGSIMKIIINQYYATYYDLCGLFLGVAVLLVWIGVLRYLGYLRYYNVLLVTLKVAFPTVIRFIFCVLLIYFGFAYCGWIVFGPYHYKFRDLSVTSECLFSLVNGDDMFATFKSLKHSNVVVWVFLQLYLYSFISLFIFVVLSLFIGIISDTYERIKDYGHPPKSRVQLFMDDLEYQTPKTADQDADYNESGSSQQTDPNSLCPHRYNREERHNFRTSSGLVNNDDCFSPDPNGDLISFRIPDSL